MTGFLFGRLLQATRWHSEAFGLAQPTIVTEATDEYFENEDSFGQWIEDECDVDIGNQKKWDKVSSLFEAWVECAVKVGDKPALRRRLARP